MYGFFWIMHSCNKMLWSLHFVIEELKMSCTCQNKRSLAFLQSYKYLQFTTPSYNFIQCILITTTWEVLFKFSLDRLQHLFLHTLYLERTSKHIRNATCKSNIPHEQAVDWRKGWSFTMDSLIKTLLSVIWQSILLHCTECFSSINDLAALVNLRSNENTKLSTSCSRDGDL